MTRAPKQFKMRYTSINLFHGDVEELKRRASVLGVGWQRLAREGLHLFLTQPEAKKPVLK